jgi:hypothetical protein
VRGLCWDFIMCILPLNFVDQQEEYKGLLKNHIFLYFSVCEKGILHLSK